MKHDPTQQHEHHVADVLTDPHARLSAALILSLVLWAPFGLAALRSDIDVVAAGVRYLIAFLGCRFAVSGIAHLVVSYRSMQALEHPEVQLAPVTLTRRATDPPAA